jgi:hypothetical protein
MRLQCALSGLQMQRASLRRRGRGTSRADAAGRPTAVQVKGQRQLQDGQDEQDKRPWRASARGSEARPLPLPRWRGLPHTFEESDGGQRDPDRGVRLTSMHKLPRGSYAVGGAARGRCLSPIAVHRRRQRTRSAHSVVRPSATLTKAENDGRAGKLRRAGRRHRATPHRRAATRSLRSGIGAARRPPLLNDVYRYRVTPLGAVLPWLQFPPCVTAREIVCSLGRAKANSSLHDGQGALETAATARIRRGLCRAGRCRFAGR